MTVPGPARALYPPLPPQAGGSELEASLTWNIIKTSLATQIVALTKLKFLNPKMDEGDMRRHFELLVDSINVEFDKLTEK